jgi:Tfp pilus assembly protein PilF
MKKTLISTLCILTLICLVAGDNLFGIQAIGYGRLEGRVVDEEGNPIPNATITVEKLQHVSKKLTTFKKSVTTNEKGIWIMFNVLGGDVIVTATAEGYFPETERVEISQGYPNFHVNFKLKKAATPTELPEPEELSINTTEYLEEGAKYYREEKYEDAIKLYQLVLDKSPENYVVHKDIGNCYMMMEQYDLAEKEFLEFLSAAKLENSPTSIPMQSDALSSLGTISARKDDNETALNYFLEAYNLNPMDEEVNYNLGEIHFSLRKIDEAIQYYRVASDIKPSWPEPYMKLGFAYLNKSDTPKAKEYFEKFLEIAPDHPQAEGIRYILKDIKDK